MPDIEINVTTKRKGGNEFAGLERDAKQSFSRIEKAADIKGKVDVDTKGIAKLEGDFREMRDTARQTMAEVNRQLKVDGRVSMDIRQVDMAKAALRDLDNIPPPQIDIETDAEQEAANVEDVFGDMSFGGMASQLSGAIQGALSAAGPAGQVAAAAAVGLGALVGEELMAGMKAGFKGNANAIRDAVKNNLSDADAARMGKSAGDAYADGFGESLESVRETAGLLENTLSGLDASFDVTSVTKKAEALAQVWGVDVTQSIEVARRMIANNLAPDAESAFNMMGDAAQKNNLQIEEIMDVMREFAPVFGKLGIEGARAFDIIGTAVAEGLLPNVSRGAELFEEFNIEMQDIGGRAKPVIDALGLSFEELQAKIAAGKGAEALAEVSGALLKVGDEARRDEMAITLFGTAIESASDPQRVLELLAMADATGEVGTAMDDAVDSIESTRSGLDELKSVAGQVGSVWGSALNDELRVFMDLIKGNPIDAFTDGWHALVGVATDLGDALGITSEEGRIAAEEFDNLKQKTIDNADAYGYNATAQDELHGALGRTRDELDGTADSTADAASEIERLDAAFAALAGKFDGDAAIRGLHDRLRELSEAELDATGATYELGVGFDQTTQAGGAIAAQLEDVHADLLDVAEAHRNGTATSLELAQAQNSTEGALRAVARQLGLNEAETADLIARYSEVPSDIHTEIALEGNAFDRVRQIAADLMGLQGSTFTTYLRTHTYTTTATRPSLAKNTYSRAGGISTAAEGGLYGGGGMTLVGEEGPELVRLGIGAQVYSTSDTDAMSMATMGGPRRTIGSMGGGSGGGGAGPTVVVNVHGSIVTERDIREIVADGFRQGGLL